MPGSADRSHRYPHAARHLGTSGIARALGVDPRVVAKWIERYPPDSAHPFPAPDVSVGDRLSLPPSLPAHQAWGWREERLDEIREWRANMPGRGAGGGRPRR